MLANYTKHDSFYYTVYDFQTHFAYNLNHVLYIGMLYIYVHYFYFGRNALINIIIHYINKKKK